MLAGFKQNEEHLTLIMSCPSACPPRSNGTLQPSPVGRVSLGVALFLASRKKSLFDHKRVILFTNQNRGKCEKIDVLGGLAHKKPTLM